MESAPSLFNRIFVLASLLILTGCDRKGDMHELSFAGFNDDFYFEGYAVDNGDRWIYFLIGGSGKFEIGVDAPLM